MCEIKKSTIHIEKDSFNLHAIKPFQDKTTALLASMKDCSIKMIVKEQNCTFLHNKI